METPVFKTNKELFDWLVENKSRLIAQKKASVKFADGVPFLGFKSDTPEQKAEIKDGEAIRGELIINTTMIFDSHKDVHLPGNWNKSAKEKKYRILNKEHNQGFEDIISDGDDIKTSVKTFTWKELGFSYPGETQALTYDTIIRPDENPYMYKKYRTGKVRNHSVEMYYMKLEMAINDEDYKEEFAEWNKWIDKIANKEDAIESGYFFPIYEAKDVGAAAVPRGSNFATPTQSITELEPPEGTQKKIEPSNDTQVNEFKLLIKQILS